jgi:hypothetical protein
MADEQKPVGPFCPLAYTSADHHFASVEGACDCRGASCCWFIHARGCAIPIIAEMALVIREDMSWSGRGGAPK